VESGYILVVVCTFLESQDSRIMELETENELYEEEEKNFYLKYIITKETTY
jgi:hypothetical protein